MPLSILCAASHRTNCFTDGIGNKPPDILSRSSGRPIAGVVGQPPRNILTNKSSRRVWMVAPDNISEVQRPPSYLGDLVEIWYAGDLLYGPCFMVSLLCVTPHITDL